MSRIPNVNNYPDPTRPLVVVVARLIRPNDPPATTTSRDAVDIVVATTVGGRG